MRRLAMESLPVLAAISLACGGGERAESRGAAGSTAASEPAGAATADQDAGGRADEPQVVNAVARDYMFELEGDIPAGLTTIRLSNHGRATHHMQLYRLEQGRSTTDLLAAVKAVFTGRPWPAWAVPAGGPGGVSPGGESNATMTLEPGAYALACWVPDSTGAPHLMRGMIRAARVVPAESAAPATPPRADVTAMLTDYDFAFSPRLTAGTRTIRVVNGGPQRHEIQIWRLSPGRSVDDFMSYLKANEVGEAPGAWVGGVSELEAGHTAYMTVPLEPGEYALICFVMDSKDGKPHFAHGMVKQITVPEAATASAPAESGARAGTG